MRCNEKISADLAQAGHFCGIMRIHCPALGCRFGHRRRGKSAGSTAGCKSRTSAVRDRHTNRSSQRAAKEYLVRRCADGIGIYDGTGSVLYELLDVDVRSLPAADRAMLEMGILVTGEAALRALTEDYSS